MLVDGEGAILDQARSDFGILNCADRSFGMVLSDQIAVWFERFPGEVRIPVLMSGMIGSRQGWQEADYLRCPASPHDLARSLLPVAATTAGLERCDVRIVPGMDIAGVTEDCALPDVMRGEETQVFGALLGARINHGVFVLPGTHSKWVLVEKGMIAKFHTYMTGEVYAALLDATILGKLADDSTESEEGFALGVGTARGAHAWAGPGQLLNMAFTARSRVLHGEMEPSAVRSYMSGLLIAAEMQSGRSVGSGRDDAPRPVYVIGEDSLCRRYQEAAVLLGVETKVAVQNPVPIAHLAIARLADFVP